MEKGKGEKWMLASDFQEHKFSSFLKILIHNTSPSSPPKLFEFQEYKILGKIKTHNF